MCYSIETFKFLLSELNEKLAANDEHEHIVIVGGAAMALVYGVRDSTHDIDAIFEPKSEMLSYIREIADELKINYDWLKDSVKGFINPTTMRTEPLYVFSNLTVDVTDAETLLAMKLTSARADPGTHDIEDAIALAEHLGVSTDDELFDVVERHAYPNQLTAQCNFFIKMIAELLAERQ